MTYKRNEFDGSAIMTLDINNQNENLWAFYVRADFKIKGFLQVGIGKDCLLNIMCEDKGKVMVTKKVASANTFRHWEL